MAARSYGQHSGLVAALDQIGERWALLIVRDLLVGPRRFSHLKAGLPRIPTNILSARLKELQASGVVRRVPLAHGLVYVLTDYGRSLEDIVIALERWGITGMTEPNNDDVLTADSLTITFRAAFRADVAESGPSTIYEAHIGDLVLTLRVARGALTVTPAPALSASAIPAAIPAAKAAPSADLQFACDARIYELISGELSPQQAISQGVVRALHGDPALLDRFAASFHAARLPLAQSTVAAG